MTKIKKELHLRSLIKTIGWRVLATLTTIVIVFAFTGKLVLSLGIGVVEVITKLILYYFHERLWAKISWGKPKHPLDDLLFEKELTPEDKDVIRKRLQDLGYLK